MDSCEEADIGENVELTEERLQEAEIVNIGEHESVAESIFESKVEAFNLYVSLTILVTETDDVDAEFLKALTERRQEIVSLPELHQSL